MSPKEEFELELFTLVSKLKYFIEKVHISRDVIKNRPLECIAYLNLTPSTLTSRQSLLTLRRPKPSLCAAPPYRRRLRLQMGKETSPIMRFPWLDFEKIDSFFIETLSSIVESIRTTSFR
ncbi:hypothetical protein M9H77_07466 [Catharanthus roseus]|uniref:Uncharacterized protein n=1 Tax=Catharanthus roseus TaxID=4058 RepID=A0ACC0BV22_CATRO|nr:hypothetical protein M9H77_07466 [Catharanthus roseus]